MLRWRKISLLANSRNIKKKIANFSSKNQSLYIKILYAFANS